MLETDFNGIVFKNPILTASGTFGFGKEFKDYIDLNRLGGIVTTGITLKGKKGNSGRRIHEVTAGILNSIGLENDGIDSFLENEYKELMDLDCHSIVNLGGNSFKDYIEGAKLLEEGKVAMMELNISCPNVKEGGMAFGLDEKVAYDLISQVRKIYGGQLIVKLSPNGDVKKISKAAEDAGADAISLVNTFSGLAIDIDERKAVFENKIAGLSGPCIKPIALRMVYEVANTVSLPVIGIGGIKDYKDVVEFIMAGASLVEVGSMNFINPKVTMEIIEDLEEYMKREKLASLEEIRGII